MFDPTRKICALYIAYITIVMKLPLASALTISRLRVVT